MGQRPYCLSRVEVIYCTFGFGAIIRRDLRTLSLLRDSPRDNQYACAISSCGKGNSSLMKLFGGLSYETIQRYSNSSLYVMARWPPQQIPPLNFLGLNPVVDLPWVFHNEIFIFKLVGKLNNAVWKSHSLCATVWFSLSQRV